MHRRKQQHTQKKMKTINCFCLSLFFWFRTVIECCLLFIALLGQKLNGKVRQLNIQPFRACKKDEKVGIEALQANGRRRRRQKRKKKRDLNQAERKESFESPR